MKVQNFQEKFCQNFDLLEKKDSNLLDQIEVYLDLKDLAQAIETKEIIGEKLLLAIESTNLFSTIFSKESIAFYYLSRYSFSKMNSNGSNPEIKPDELEQTAIEFIKKLYIQMKKTNLLPKPSSENSQSQQPSGKKRSRFDDDSDEAEICEIDSSEIDNELAIFENTKSKLKCLDFWNSFGSQMPILSMIYRHLSCIPAANSAVERAFSSSKLVFDDLSSNSSLETIEAQMMLCFDRFEE